MARQTNLGSLVVVEGPNPGQRYPVNDGLLFGRAPGCAGHLDDRSVSHEHLRIRVKGQEVRVEDLGSSNGTWVNDRQVSDAVLLPGDRVKIGDSILVYEAPGLKRRLPRGVLVGALVGVVCLAAVAWYWDAKETRHKRDIDEHIRWAQEFEKQRDYRDAAYEYEFLDRLIPNRGYHVKVVEMNRYVMRDAALSRIALAAEFGKFEAARTMLDSLKRMYPDDQEVARWVDRLNRGEAFFAAVSRARSLRDANKYDEALAVLDSMARTVPDQSLATEVVEILLQKAYGLRNHGKRTAAEQAFAAVLQRDPGNPEAKQALAAISQQARFVAYEERPLPRRQEQEVSGSEEKLTHPHEELVEKNNSGTAYESGNGTPGTGNKTPDAGNASEANATPEQENEPVAVGDTAGARVAWEEAVQLLVDYGDTSKAVAKLFETIRLAPDPSSRYNRKATERLKKLGRL